MIKKKNDKKKKDKKRSISSEKENNREFVENENDEGTIRDEKMRRNQEIEV